MDVQFAKIEGKSVCYRVTVGLLAAAPWRASSRRWSCTSMASTCPE